MTLSTSQLRSLGSVLYFAAAALMINIMAQFTVQVWPIKFGELNWRVGAAGLFMDVLMNGMVPMAMMFFAAFMNEDRKLLQAFRWISLVLGVVTIGMLLGFALDAVQIRSQLPQNVKAVFLKTALRASLSAVLCSTAFIWMSFSLAKVLKSQGVVRASGVKDPAQESMLMVGTSREPSPSRPNLRAIDSSDSKTEAATGLAIDI
jgi:hypothetical protein